MKGPRPEELQTILAQGRWDRAIGILQRLDPAVAADPFASLPYEQQQVLFGRLPVEFAAKLAPIFPYYDTFVLLHTLSTDQMSAVVAEMNPIERSMFLDELPETAWQQITKELSEKHGVASFEDERWVAPGVAPATPSIIEARGIEKSFQRPGGGRVQVIAPISISVEPGAIVALLGPSGSGKST